MRLILFDCPSEKRIGFHPLALSRPIFELRTGIDSLGDKLVASTGASDVAYFVPPYLAAAYRAATPRPVNDPATLMGDDLLLVDGRVKAREFSLSELPAIGPSCVAADSTGEVACVRVAHGDLGKLKTDSIDALLESARAVLPAADAPVPVWKYIWELVLENPSQLASDFAALGRSGIEGRVEEPAAIRGDKRDIYVAPGAVVHPMVVLDAQPGPIYLDQGVEVQPFTRIEGPCYVGPGSVLLGCKCRHGNSIGRMCRLGGEVEESIIQGYSNKYHDGFLGHAYVGQWVNLGAMTTNSDLKNDYSKVSVVLDGKTPIDTGSNKVGSLIGDHAKTSIGTLLNTGAYVGAMAVLVADGRLLPKFIPSFAWYLDGLLSEGFGKTRLYEAAKAAMRRRQSAWTDDDERLWDAVFELTATERERAFRRAKSQAR